MTLLLSLKENRLLRWALALSGLFILSILLLRPELSPSNAAEIDSVTPSLQREAFFTMLHLIAFGGLSFLWVLALKKDLPLGTALLIAALFLVSYGFVTELAQGSIAGRSVQLGDMIANCLGIMLGLGFFYRLSPQFES